MFTPGHLYTKKQDVGSHEEIVDYFINKHFWVYLSNGYFKGFIQSNGARELLDEFNLKHHILGQLRDSLLKWNFLYPSDNIAITGYWTIERGITFCTDGFNFTHIIISNYHSTKLNKLIQLVGRVNGNEKYFGAYKYHFICPKNIYNTITETINKTIELRNINPINYNQTDFNLLD